ncbi:MAG TPA: tRNA-dihydrouridine synthase [Patescibacteria group bacterium]
MKTIWNKLDKPIFILAPMEDVTDTVFRRIISTCGRPDLYFTEFTNVDGLASKGDKIVSQRILYTPKEKPLIAQIWGMKPENYFKAAQRLSDMGYNGIDINMGCPQRTVTRHGACSALIKNPSLAKEIIQATKEGANGLPVSVKTRIGFNKIVLEEWIGFLLDQDLPALTIHGRTAAEMSKVPAHWDEIGKAVDIRNAKKVKTLIIGNGDIKSLQEAKEKAKQYNLDGIMVGRGIFENPWLFNSAVSIENITIQDRIALLKKHVDLYVQTWGENKNFQILKKYFKIYISNFDGAHELRTLLMATNNQKEVDKILQQYEAKIK